MPEERAVFLQAIAEMRLSDAEEEAAIRTNPAARTTDLLKRVFGGALR